MENTRTDEHTLQNADKYTLLNASWTDTKADGTKSTARLSYDIGKNLDQHTVDAFKHALCELEARLSPDIPLRISVNTYLEDPFEISTTKDDTRES